MSAPVLAPSGDTIAIYDLRSERVPSAPKVSMAPSGKPRLASPKTGVTIHQTAAEFGVTTAAIKLAGGDRRLALARRATGVACHAMAFREGFGVLASPLAWRVNHGNGLNGSDLGLEVEGRHEGIVGDRKTLWCPQGPGTCSATERTELLLTTARETLRVLVETARAEGHPIAWVHAHRQSSATRRSDPGEWLWRELVLAYAVPVLGLRTRPGRVLGDGRPVPLAWDPAHGVGGY